MTSCVTGASLSCRTFNSVDCCVCLTLPPSLVIGGFSWGLRGLCCWSGTTWAADSVVPHAAAGAAGAQALRGQRKGAPSLGGFRSSLRPCIFVFPFLFQYVGSN